MFDPASRYVRTQNATFVAGNGRTVVYKRRRALPALRLSSERAVTTLRPGDRLDLVAARTLGDPLQFWRIADANLAMNPFDLMERRTLFVPSVVPETE